MKLRVFLPASASPAARPPLAWILRDARGEVLRRERTPLDDMPRVDDAELVLPAERVLFARLKLPRVNASTIRELLPYAVEDRLLADPAHIHAVAGPRNARGETLVAVVDREWLADWVRALSRAGLRVRAAWCESALLAGGRGDWHVVLDDLRGMVVDDDGVAATFDRGDSLPLAVRLALDEASGRGERPTSISVHPANGTPIPPLEAWSAEAGVPFQAAHAWEGIAGNERPAGTMDLLHGIGETKRPWHGLLPRAALALAAAIALLQIGFTAVDALRLRHEARAIEARREAVFREAFPEARNVVDPERQMTRNLAQLQRERGVAAGDEFLSAMTRVARERNGAVKSVQFANDKVTIQ